MPESLSKERLKNLRSFFCDLSDSIMRYDQLYTVNDDYGYRRAV